MLNWRLGLPLGHLGILISHTHTDIHTHIGVIWVERRVPMEYLLRPHALR